MINCMPVYDQSQMSRTALFFNKFNRGIDDSMDEEITDTLNAILEHTIKVMKKRENVQKLNNLEIGQLVLIKKTKMEIKPNADDHLRSLLPSGTGEIYKIISFIDLFACLKSITSGSEVMTQRSKIRKLNFQEMHDLILPSDLFTSLFKKKIPPRDSEMHQISKIS